MKDIADIIRSADREKLSVLNHMRRKWIAAALRRRFTDTDRAAAEKALTAMYRLHGEKEPFFLWSPSPLSAALMILSLRERARERPLLKSKERGKGLWEAASRSIYAPSGEHWAAVLRDSINDHVLNAVSWGTGSAFWTRVHFSRGPAEVVVRQARDGQRQPIAGADFVLEGILTNRLADPMQEWLVSSIAEVIEVTKTRDARLNHNPDGDVFDLEYDEETPPNSRVQWHENPRHFDPQIRAFIEGTSAWRLMPYVAAFHGLREAFGFKFGPRFTQVFSMWMSLVKHAFWWWSFKGICVVSEHPAVLSTVEERGEPVIHAENSPAVAFRDGWQVYAIRGVRVPPEVVDGPPSRLDPGLLLQIRNSEVRRVIVRRIGLERICEELKAASMDKRKDYELLSLRLSGRDLTFLKMINPSTGEVHIEGVDPHCRTVGQALRWRNGTDTRPTILT